MNIIALLHQHRLISSAQLKDILETEDPSESTWLIYNREKQVQISIYGDFYETEVDDEQNMETDCLTVSLRLGDDSEPLMNFTCDLNGNYISAEHIFQGEMTSEELVGELP